MRTFAQHFGQDRAAPADLDTLRPSGTDPAQLAFSSGTTGEPKGVLHTFDTVWTARAPYDRLGLGAGDVVLMASPVTHQLGYLYGVLMPLCLGLTVVYQDVWDAATMLDLVETHGVTWTMAATQFVVDAVRAQRAAHRRLDSLRHVVSCGAPIPASWTARHARCSAPSSSPSGDDGERDRHHDRARTTPTRSSPTATANACPGSRSGSSTPRERRWRRARSDGCRPPARPRRSAITNAPRSTPPASSTAGSTPATWPGGAPTGASGSPAG